MAGRFETLANLAIVAVCVAVGTQVVITGVRSAQSAPSAPTLTPIDFARADQTLLLVVRDGCQFCENNMAFYRDLASALKGNETAVQLVAVTPTAPQTTHAYLGRYGVEIPLVSQSTFDQLKISGTPTLILTNRDGIVSNVWVGQLSDSRQAEVLRALHTSARARS
jgi:peroxiredoxin